MSERSAAFRQAALDVVARIPEGRVTTYGRIAAAIGRPRRARHVVLPLAGALDAGDYSCHRVVNCQGFLAGGWSVGDPDVMRLVLEEEGVPFIGEHTVDLDACLWEPPEPPITLDDPQAWPRRHLGSARGAP